jgi:hypothetical protein
MTIEIVDLPIDSMGNFHSYVKLPEGTWQMHKRYLQDSLHLNILNIWGAS